MKKKIILIMTTALLLGGSIGFAAASSSLIGSKVQGLFTVKKADGTKIGEAVIINGSAFAPVRSISEATGTELSVEGKTIIMGSKSNTASANGETTTAETVNSTAELQIERTKVVTDIETHEKQIKGYNDNILPTYKSLADELANNGTLGQRAADDYAQFKKQVDTWEAELKVLKTRLVEIDSQIRVLNP